MSEWASYPDNYRQKEVEQIAAATRSGESVLLIGLSGAGKSNLLGFLANRISTPTHPFLLVDANRLLEPTPQPLYRLMARGLGYPVSASIEAIDGLEMALQQAFQEKERLTFLLDRFDMFIKPAFAPLLNSLRAWRDEHKYRLTYVLALRRPLPADNELAELFHAHTLWLGPMSQSDSLWNVARYARRVGQTWSDAAAHHLIQASWGYPSLLRAACEAYANGSGLAELSHHPVVQARVEEFWHDHPPAEAVAYTGLTEHPWLASGRVPTVATIRLTAKEKRLFDCLRAQMPALVEKDELIRAVWPEDKLFEDGGRDDSLAQLMRRLRRKIEPDATRPQIIQTVPGRGYRLTQEVRVIGDE
ncbi:MAG: winged helix-turn-helix domain-containing protein [Anaerolineae bacterium]|nr:winged helix-turn-helix domain-containing protein [Anaerolineae bacterium]